MQRHEMVNIDETNSLSTPIPFYRVHILRNNVCLENKK